MRVLKESKAESLGKASNANESKIAQKRKKKSELRALKATTSIEDNPQIIKREKPVKEFSDREIREKLSVHLNKSNSANTMSKIKKEELLGAGFLNEEEVSKKIETQKQKEIEAQKKALDLASPTANISESKTTISVERIEKPSDVGLNDPKDSLTSSKLKSVLDMGAFNFNPKEREVLSKILSERV